MNRDNIIRMAREAGLDPDLWNYTDAFERFATLVAAAERQPLHDFIARLLDPEDLGHAVTAEVRQKAGALLRRTKYD
jgi:hypothetical protein